MALEMSHTRSNASATSEQEELQLIEVTIEVPRWSFVKYSIDPSSDHGAGSQSDGGHIDFLSPLPCPFNYGFVRGTVSGDGQPQDAIVIGKRLNRYAVVQVPVRAVVCFIDNGDEDPKLVCSEAKLSKWNLLLLRVGFHVYVGMKWIINRSRGRTGTTQYQGIHECTPSRLG